MISPPEPLSLWKRTALRTLLGICDLRAQWLKFYQRRAQLRIEAVTRRRFHRSIAERERAFTMPRKPITPKPK